MKTEIKGNQVEGGGIVFPDLAVQYRDGLEKYACHLYLDCYQGCTCGLDELTDRLGMPRCDRHPT